MGPWWPTAPGWCADTSHFKHPQRATTHRERHPLPAALHRPDGVPEGRPLLGGARHGAIVRRLPRLSRLDDQHHCGKCRGRGPHRGCYTVRVPQRKGGRATEGGSVNEQSTLLVSSGPTQGTWADTRPSCPVVRSSTTQTAPGANCCSAPSLRLCAAHKAQRPAPHSRPPTIRHMVVRDIIQLV